MIAPDVDIPSSGNISTIMACGIDGVVTAYSSIFSFEGGDYDYQFDAGAADEFSGRLLADDVIVDDQVTCTGGPFPGPNIYSINLCWDTSTAKVKIGGVTRATGDYSVNKIVTQADFHLFRNRALGAKTSGVIAEVVSIGDDCSDTEATKIEGYLAWKWGLVDKLPSDHPYKYAPPTV